MRTGTPLLLSWLLMAISSQGAEANLVANGNFGTGNFIGWTSPVNPSIMIDSSFSPPTDTFDAAFTGGGTLSQIVRTTPGSGYTLSFSLLDEAGFFLDSFKISLGAFSKTIAGNTATTYQKELLAIPGADIMGSSATLSFQGSDPSGQNWNLDDVSIVATPTSVPAPPMGAILAGAVLILFSLRHHRQTDKS